jgi:hypothetical protein
MIAITKQDNKYDTEKQKQKKSSASGHSTSYDESSHDTFWGGEGD